MAKLLVMSKRVKWNNRVRIEWVAWLLLHGGAEEIRGSCGIGQYKRKGMVRYDHSAGC
jgi:hypothetical protein